MKRSQKFLLSQIAGNNVLIPVGKGTADFNKMISLNDMGVIVWKMLEKETTANEIVDAILAEYDVSREQATTDVEAFLTVLGNADCLES